MNDIKINGILTIEIPCDNCGLVEAVNVKVDHEDWLSEYGIDIEIDPREVIQTLQNKGWGERGIGYICPDCKEEYNLYADRYGTKESNDN